MAFERKTWIDRQAEFPARRKLNPTGTADVYDVSRDEGLILEEGDPFNAATMNALEGRIEAALNDTILPATCTYSSGVFTLSGLPDNLPDIFTVRFKAPADFAEGDTFAIGALTLQAKLTNQEDAGDELFKSGAVVTMEVDKGAETAFFKSGGGGFPDGWRDVRTAEATEDIVKNQAVVFWTNEEEKDVVSPYKRLSSTSFAPPGLIGMATQSATLGSLCTVNLFPVINLDPEYDPILANNTWEQIGQAIADNEVPATWTVGSEKDILLSTGEVLTTHIWGENHDDLTAGGKARFTFGLKNLMAATRYMNATDTNVGGFTGSELYGWLNGYLFNLLPPDLRAIIKPVDKKTSAGNQSATINTDSMKIFLPSEVECFGTTTYSAAGEGSQYPIFTDAASRIKRLENGAGAASIWWERSPSASYATHFCAVDSGGSAYYNGASVSRGVCFGFCV